VAGGGVREGNRGWLPSTDVHALRYLNGKLQPLHLVYIAADEKTGFRMIGTKRFCWSKVCRTKSHKPKAKKFAMGCKDGWFISGKTDLMGQPNLFVYPFLDASKITEDTFLSLKSYSERRTTEEWEDFIFKAQEEWEELQACTLENIQEGHNNDDQEDKDDDQLMEEGDLILLKPPKTFEWANKVNVAGIKDNLDKGEAVEKLQVAIGDLEGMVGEACIDARHSAQEILTHIGCSVTELVAAVDRINWRGRRWANHIGDVQACGRTAVN
jgi:hypothetical protein